MEEPLDNPVWHALTGPHAGFAIGSGAGRHYRRDLAPFSAIAEPTQAAYADLAADLPAGSVARLFRPMREPPPRGWETLGARPIIQMTANGAAMPVLPAEREIVLLESGDWPAMESLAEIVQPGPYTRRAPLLGRYVGIKRDGRLLAMAGERFHLPGHVELSAISVHPDARGSGLGAAMVTLLARDAQARGKTPFLHVFPDNPAAQLYARLGFRERARLWVLFHRLEVR